MAKQQPVLLLTTKHRPHEQLLLAYGSLSGLTYLFRGAPNVVDIVLPGPLVAIWSLALVVSGVLGLIGCWWRTERGMGVEAGALLMMVGPLLIFSTAVLVAVGFAGSFSAGLIVAWAAANLWRVLQIRRELAQLRGAQWTDG